MLRSRNATTEVLGASPKSKTCCSKRTQGNSFSTTSDMSFSPQRMSSVSRPHQTCHLAKVCPTGLRLGHRPCVARDQSQPGDNKGRGMRWLMAVSPSDVGEVMRSETYR